VTETLVVWLPDTFMRKGCDLLDTKVIAELMRPNPNLQVPAWTDGLGPGQTAITAMNEAEILHGIVRLPRESRKRVLQESWDALLPAPFDGRVWAFAHGPPDRHGRSGDRGHHLGPGRPAGHPQHGRFL
jgi:hypothetical protein